MTTTTIKTPDQGTERDRRDNIDGLRSAHGDSATQGEKRGFWRAIAEVARASRYRARSL